MNLSVRFFNFYWLKITFLRDLISVIGFIEVRRKLESLTIKSDKCKLDCLFGRTTLFNSLSHTVFGRSLLPNKIGFQYFEHSMCTQSKTTYGKWDHSQPNLQISYKKRRKKWFEIKAEKKRNTLHSVLQCAEIESEKKNQSTIVWY